MHGVWVYDDLENNLIAQPFVVGADKAVDKVVEMFVTDSSKGFNLYFSDQPFPGFKFQWYWVREEKGGNWYRGVITGGEGWVGAFLYKYFDSPPKCIYATFSNSEIVIERQELTSP